MTQKGKLTDLSYLKEMSGNDNSIIGEMIEIFIEQIPEFTGEVSSYFEAHDWNRLGAVAHKAKSSVRTMGMESIGECLEKLEHYSKGNLKSELQLKKDKGIELSSEDEKNWNNVMHEPLSDIKLDYIPELVSTFLSSCPLAVNELKSTLQEL
ncbi:Hpt domain-containing protein [Marinifilum sp. RC60d5]|uniref:Hpt domain-containing protein n=1 Tax=Marinifilum sp. RC60d5 TaxID=3458414 RepID=UPI0040354357